MPELIALLALLAAIFYFNDAAIARDVARARAREVCQGIGAQFLDQSVAFAGLALKRNSQGQMRFVRRYRFEFSREGLNREPGWVRMIGAEIDTVAIKGDEGWQYL